MYNNNVILKSNVRKVILSSSIEFWKIYRRKYVLVWHNWCFEILFTPTLLISVKQTKILDVHLRNLFFFLIMHLQHNEKVLWFEKGVLIAIFTIFL